MPDEYEHRVDRAAQRVARYTEGEDRYINMAREVFGVTPAETQERILRGMANHQRLLIVSGNGVGKSYAVAVAILTFLFSHPDSLALLTSGSYSMLTDTTWRPMKSMHKQAQENVGLPGTRLESPPRLETDMGEEWFFKAVSPVYPDNLEGRHAEHALIVIEEADKPDITDEHFDSAASTIVDAEDRMIAVANPPRDENNVVYEKMQSDRWHVIQFSSFESHNVMRDAEEIDDDAIPGLVDLPTVAEDYEAWNGQTWPKMPGPWDTATALKDVIDDGELPRDKAALALKRGLDEAKRTEPGLDTRWYRRRLGVIPPDDSKAPRPWTVGEVEDAEARWETTMGAPVIYAIGVDVARGGDRTAIAEIRGKRMEIVESRRVTDHTENERLITKHIDDESLDGPLAIDAVGEGSALADTLRRRFAQHRVERFNSGANADDDENYYDARTEALQMLGDWLRDGGSVRPDSAFASELKTHARYCEYEERTLRAATTYKATPKDDIKENLGQSPDLVDAAAMCAWAADGFGKGSATYGAWGSEYA